MRSCILDVFPVLHSIIYWCRWYIWRHICMWDSNNSDISIILQGNASFYSYLYSERQGVRAVKETTRSNLGRRPTSQR